MVFKTLLDIRLLSQAMMLKAGKFNRNLKSGAYPIIWTRGLEAGSDKWSVDSPWAGEGGHVLFSDGTIRWYDDTKGQDEKGVFIGAINKEDGADKKSESD